LARERRAGDLVRLRLFRDAVEAVFFFADAFFAGVFFLVVFFFAGVFFFLAGVFFVLAGDFRFFAEAATRRELRRVVGILVMWNLALGRLVRK
jgi:ABC-type protease/lipase transport system fused ATPase/permease subunit